MPAANVINGNDGNNRLTGTDGTDIIRGGAGNDRLAGGGGNDLLLGGPTFLLSASQEDRDVMRGGQGDDVLIGGQSTDVLTGGAGRDVFTLQTVNLGDMAENVAEYEDFGRDVVIDFQRGTDRIAVEIDVQEEFLGDADTTILPFEAFDRNGDGVLDAGDGPAVRIQNVTHDGQTALSTVLHLGTDFAGMPSAGTIPAELVLHGVTGLKKADFVGGGSTSQGFGSEAPDEQVRFFGGYDADVIRGTARNDLITDLGGTNYIDAARGDDQVVGGLGADEIRGGAGDDWLSGEDGDDLVFGGIGQDRIVGFDGDDRLYGGIGNDSMSAGDGKDLLDGGGGDDVLQGGTGRDVLLGGAGNDTLTGLGDPFAGTENVLRGGAGDDVLQAGVGEGINNILFGDAGNDQLYTGGQDRLTGGSGDDVFLIGDDVNVSAIDVTILDFGQGDDVLALVDFRPQGGDVDATFDSLDSNDDNVLNAFDSLLTERSVTIDGTAKQSLVFLQLDTETNTYVPGITLWGVTDLARTAVAAS